ncbi:DUF4437 domain-containing protein [Microbulbifer thermotolerans]|uniref:DUF4437 domain-containing protein n=1 Tax=Microbulbifer thermotolerans TaxID=252514 RepID=UPI00224B7FEA|nr:DUF4437 domain-containing protein [Microbulbifer thermotolerans]MCX2835082.1 DUF4437 domain-containing protein [Microbulbifer thermotolerans]WKT60711.1 DUF4437 domain-containing protein [Microbulbifer thermotolerans]
MFSRRVISAIFLAGAAALANADDHDSGSLVKVMSAEEVEWGYLNPLRGALSPGAADLWGDRTGGNATGMLVRFKKGFESPPHIHNITYRGIVIDGQMHNDDPSAAKMWMPPGSFWTQPAGEDHTTAANGETNLIYLEIDSGPYLVMPSDEQFDNGERPLNLHADNMVWQDNSDLYSIQADKAEATQLWRSTANMNGSMIKLNAGFKGELTTEASEFRAVVIGGEISYGARGLDKPKLLEAGSYIESTGDYTHQFVNNSDGEVTIYIRTDGRYTVQ